MKKHRIFVLSENAQIYGMEWDEAILTGELETVKEFESYAEAVAAFESGNYNPEIYGVE